LPALHGILKQTDLYHGQLIAVVFVISNCDPLTSHVSIRKPGQVECLVGWAAALQSNSSLIGHWAQDVLYFVLSFQIMTGPLITRT
jgi:hypothetical protein